MKRKILQKILNFFSKIILWRYKPIVIGVAGSVGKTSTKEAIFAVLKNKFLVGKNELNLNTEVGLAISIIGGKDAKRSVSLWLINFFYAFKKIIFFDRHYPKILVLEMSEDAPTAIKKVVRLAQPRIGVITAIGKPPVHLENYKNLGELKEEIGFLPQSLPASGTAVLNADDPDVLNFQEKILASVITYGFGEKADMRITNYKLINSENLEKIGMTFRLEYKGSFVPVKLEGVFGKPQAYALAAAACVGAVLNMNLVEIVEGMENYQIVKGRTKFIKGVKNSWLLDDSYNASPDSVNAVLDLIKEIPTKRKIVVLGDMKELGRASEEAHKKIGEKAAEVADIFFGVGESMKLAKEAIRNKYPRKTVFWFGNNNEAKELLKENIKEGDLVLIKGSRAMEMDRITDFLKV
ncbi:MAG: UDP-N-acetylmuramoyl-tripeptide--D-alanyl-D-alanine ligase [Candidatus Pacebacteria bacterium]|nr:UDP-N-acetylmuramoyl-tripeptide--D-alanyl-D-alanine ligase [Candidatus Paceibacterota bacterium]